MALCVRGFNPVWLFVDLQGNVLDDRYYMFVLENTIPYIPAVVYHYPDFTGPWTQPIRFLGNGTLPTDIFFDNSQLYRLEIRMGPTQSAPLIYVINDYSPGGSGSNPPTPTVTFSSSNQITNPQFSLVSFSGIFSLTGTTNPAPIEVGPGWFLELIGTGNVELEQVSLNDLNENPSNAPYLLRIKVSGWSDNGVTLRQRLQQNGMLWANKIVSSAITTRVEGVPQSLTADLFDSNGTPLGQVLMVDALSSDLTEYTGHAQLLETTNPDFPPSAYIDYRLNINSNIEIFVSSFQLIVQDQPIEFSYEQDTIDRQIDHTFHYYKDSILMIPKDSILTGWNFGLNPWQFSPTADTVLPTFGYTTDQTIVVQQNYVSTTTTNNVQIGRADATKNYGFKVTAFSANNQFAIIQYLDPTDIRPYWNQILSCLIKLNAQKQSSNTLRVKMRLIYRNSLPPILAQNEPISTWTSGQDPVFSGGWTAIAPLNDPTYNLSSGDNILSFDGINLSPSITITDNMTLGIVIYTLNNMVSTGTPDNIVFNDISLVPNRFSIASNPTTFNESLIKCQYHYRKSFPVSVLPANFVGQLGASYLSISINSTTRVGTGPSPEFDYPMRAIPSITLFNPGPSSPFTGAIYNFTTSSPWSPSTVVTNTISVRGFATTGTAPISSNQGDLSGVHWTAAALLGR